MKPLCSAMSVSKSGYYNWKKRETRDDGLAVQVKKVFNAHKGRYGAPRVWKALEVGTRKVSKRTIGRVMCKLGLRAKGGRRYRHSVGKAGEGHAVCGNKLERQFKQDKPNQVWVGDITHIETREGVLYLAVMIDLFSRKVVGWDTSTRMDQELVVSALRASLENRGYPSGVMVHTDQGSQYGAKSYLEMMKRYGLEASMSRRGNCWDNAVAESFFASLKKECIDRKNRLSGEQTRGNIFEYIEGYYNRIRQHSYHGGDSPNKFETKYQLQLQ